MLGLQPALSRDLRVKVRKAVNTPLVNSSVNSEKAVNERGAVEAAAAQTVQLVLSDRRDIQGQRSLADVLKAQLEEAIGQRELIELAIEEECAIAQTRGLREGAGGPEAQGDARSGEPAWARRDAKLATS